MIDLKIKKIFKFLIAELCMYLFLPSVLSLLCRGLSTPVDILIGTFVGLFAINLTICILARKWEKIHNKSKNWIKMIVSVLAVIFISVGMIVPTSTPYQVLNFSKSSVAKEKYIPKHALVEIPLDNGAFLEIYENRVNRGEYRCDIVRKTPFTYFISPVSFYWESEELKNSYFDGTFFDQQLPTAHINEKSNIVVLFAAWYEDDITEVYADDVKMNTVCTDDFNFAYLVVPEKNVERDDINYVLKNRNGETVIERS